MDRRFLPSKVLFPFLPLLIHHDYSRLPTVIAWSLLGSDSYGFARYDTFSFGCIASSYMTRLAAVDSSVFCAEAITESEIVTGWICLFRLLFPRR